MVMVVTSPVRPRCSANCAATLSSGTSAIPRTSYSPMVTQIPMIRMPICCAASFAFWKACGISLRLSSPCCVNLNNPT